MKIEEHNKLSKLNGKLITLDVQIIQICFQISSPQMYKIVKIQFKTMYQCTNHPDLMKNMFPFFYVFIYLNRSIVKYKDFNFKI